MKRGTIATFNECLLYVSIFSVHSRTLNNRINELDERALSLAYSHFSSSFSGLLEKDKPVIIHHCNFQTLAYEVFKVKNSMAPELLTEMFPQKESNYNL